MMYSERNVKIRKKLNMTRSIVNTAMNGKCWVVKIGKLEYLSKNYSGSYSGNDCFYCNGNI